MPDQFFIVYKYIPMNLKSLWRRKILKDRDIIQIGIQLVDCVSKLHSTGHVHNDIKLDNIMISEENEVTLIDFGQAQKYTSKGVHRPNLPVKQYGNPHFCSKNVFEDQTLSRRDDLIQVIYNLMCLTNSYKPITDLINDDPEN